MNSKAFEDFVHRINTNGYRQGYDPLLFTKINPNERDEIEKLIMDSFNCGDLPKAKDIIMF